MKVKILIFVIVLFAIGGFIFATMGIYSANPSTRIGKLHKLDETGLIFKSFEGNLPFLTKVQQASLFIFR